LPTLSGGCRSARAVPSPHRFNQGADMGKYVLAWILGVPAIVLVAIYFFAH
jgi:hypothetical protein